MQAHRLTKLHRFPNGSIVAHCLRIEGSARRFSAWFDANGGLIDCEAISKGNRTGNATRSQLAELATRGARLVAAANAESA